MTKKELKVLIKECIKETIVAEGKCRIKGCGGSVVNHKRIHGLCQNHIERQEDQEKRSGEHSAALGRIWKGHEAGEKAWQDVVSKSSGNPKLDERAKFSDIANILTTVRMLNSGKTIQQVAASAKVSPQQIRAWLKQGGFRQSTSGQWMVG